MSGVTNMIKDKIRASNNKLKEKLEGAKSKWAEETIESSQKTQDGVQHIASSPNNPFVEIKDNNESTHSSPESLEGDYVPGRKFMDDNETPPSSPVSATHSTPLNLVSELPDLDKTPKTPRVAVLSEAELYKLKAQEGLAAKETDPFQSGAPMTEAQFNNQIDAGKEKAGDIVDDEIRPSTPDFDTEMWEIEEEQVDIVKNLFNELGQIFSRCSPHAATNPEAIAFYSKNFMWNILQSDWADVPIKGTTMRKMARSITMEREEEMKETLSLIHI